jgi:hypothetical protein
MMIVAESGLPLTQAQGPRRCIGGAPVFVLSGHLQVGASFRGRH